MFEDIVLFKEGEFNLGFARVHYAEIYDADWEHAKLKQPKTKDKPIIVMMPKSGIKKIRGIDILLIHYSGDRSKTQMLNIPLCRELQKEKTAVAFSLSEIINAKEKWKTMSRMMQDIRMCRKYKIKMLFASFAKSPEEQAGSYELYSLARMLGMLPGEAKEALSSYSKLLEKTENHKTK
ncbi:hypothetical protein HZB88_05225 [archaeon]|nr:hypothetical protein [archaeon]